MNRRCLLAIGGRSGMLPDGLHEALARLRADERRGRRTSLAIALAQTRAEHGRPTRGGTWMRMVQMVYGRGARDDVPPERDETLQLARSGAASGGMQ